jgi:hypothetical protein
MGDDGVSLTREATSLQRPEGFIVEADSAREVADGRVSLCQEDWHSGVSK